MLCPQARGSASEGSRGLEVNCASTVGTTGCVIVTNGSFSNGQFFFSQLSGLELDFFYVELYNLGCKVGTNFRLILNSITFEHSCDGFDYCIPEDQETLLEYPKIDFAFKKDPDAYKFVLWLDIPQADNIVLLDYQRHMGVYDQDKKQLSWTGLSSEIPMEVDAFGGIARLYLSGRYFNSSQRDLSFSVFSIPIKDIEFADKGLMIWVVSPSGNARLIPPK